MRLQSLSIEHFRNYRSLSLDLSEAVTHVFVGENGTGKTNLLEAIGALSLTKSCRGRDDEELALWGESFYRVRGTVLPDSGKETRLEVVAEMLPRRRKACFLNDVKTPLGHMVGFLPTVIFLPQDLLLFSGPPGERRRYIDQLLSQVSPAYLERFSTYYKVLQQRNALLRRIADGEQAEDTLILWDTELARHGAAMTVARLELIETLNLSFAEEVMSLGEQWDDVRIVYERKGNARTEDDIAAELRSLLVRHRKRDLAMLSTSIGPHREDWQAVTGGRALPTFSSRGQERVAVLALLLLEVSYVELRRNERPLILLDDAFSELDDAHQDALLDAIRGCQVLMTATRLPFGVEDVRVWKVGEGTVRPGRHLLESAYVSTRTPSSARS